MGEERGGRERGGGEAQGVEEGEGSCVCIHHSLTGGEKKEERMGRWRREREGVAVWGQRLSGGGDGGGGEVEELEEDWEGGVEGFPCL